VWKLGRIGTVKGFTSDGFVAVEEDEPDIVHCHDCDGLTAEDKGWCAHPAHLAMVNNLEYRNITKVEVYGEGKYLGYYEKGGVHDMFAVYNYKDKFVTSVDTEEEARNYFEEGGK
jgi:hypothetical protein